MIRLALTLTGFGLLMAALMLRVVRLDGGPKEGGCAASSSFCW